MPRPREPEDTESHLTACAAFLAVLAGAALTGVCLYGLSNEAIKTVDQLVTYNDWPDGLPSTWGYEDVVEAIPAITMQRVLSSLSVVSACVVFAGLVGVLGALHKLRGLVCTYLLLASCFSVVVLVSAAQVSERRRVAQPLIARQVLTLCNASTYIQSSAKLGCPFAQAYDDSEVPECGMACSLRVESLARLDGCAVLPQLCERFRYETIGTSIEACTPYMDSISTAYLANIDGDACREACDRDARCTIYAHRTPSPAWRIDEVCILFAGVASQHRQAKWKAVDKAAAEGELAVGDIDCHQATSPEVLVEFQDQGLMVAIVTATLGLLLVVSAASTCLHLYNVSMRRKGLPTAGQLACMMFCPCCASHLRGRSAIPDYGKEDASLEDSDEEDE